MQKKWDYKIIATRKSDGEHLITTVHVGAQSALMELRAIDALGRDAQIIDLKTNRTITRDEIK